MDKENNNNLENETNDKETHDHDKKLHKAITTRIKKKTAKSAIWDLAQTLISNTKLEKTQVGNKIKIQNKRSKEILEAEKAIVENLLQNNNTPHAQNINKLFLIHSKITNRKLDKRKKPKADRLCLKRILPELIKKFEKYNINMNDIKVEIENLEEKMSLLEYLNLLENIRKEIRIQEKKLQEMIKEASYYETGDDMIAEIMNHLGDVEPTNYEAEKGKKKNEIIPLKEVTFEKVIDLFFAVLKGKLSMEALKEKCKGHTNFTLIIKKLIQDKKKKERNTTTEFQKIKLNDLLQILEQLKNTPKIDNLYNYKEYDKQ